MGDLDIGLSFDAAVGNGTRTFRKKLYYAADAVDNRFIAGLEKRGELLAHGAALGKLR